MPITFPFQFFHIITINLVFVFVLPCKLNAFNVIDNFIRKIVLIPKNSTYNICQWVNTLLDRLIIIDLGIVRQSLQVMQQCGINSGATTILAVYRQVAVETNSLKFLRNQKWGEACFPYIYASYQLGCEKGGAAKCHVSKKQGAIGDMRLDHRSQRNRPCLERILTGIPFLRYVANVRANGDHYILLRHITRRPIAFQNAPNRRWK